MLEVVKLAPKIFQRYHTLHSNYLGDRNCEPRCDLLQSKAKDFHQQQNREP